MHFIMYAWVHEILPFFFRENSWILCQTFYDQTHILRIDLHLEEHFFIDKFDTHMSATKQYFSSINMCSKTGPSFKNYFWYFFTDSMLGSQTARPISSLFIEYNKHCAIT